MQFLRYGSQQTDRLTDRQTDRQTEKVTYLGGCPKNLPKHFQKNKPLFFKDEKLSLSWSQPQILDL